MTIMTASPLQDIEQMLHSDDLPAQVKATLGEYRNLLHLHEATNGEGDHCLSYASRDGRFDVVKLLLAEGADVSLLGWTHVFHAIAYGSLDDLEQAIADGCDLEHRDCWKRTPLLLSMLAGDTKKANMLLAAGADLTATGPCGEPPTAYAVTKDDADMLNWLLDNGCDAGQADWFGNTPLMVAARHDATKCLRMLLDTGVDIFAENRIHQQQAITIAGSMQTVNALIKAGANIGAASKAMRAKYMGYRTDEEPDATKEEYLESGTRTFGKANPELANKPFWQAMVKCGGSARMAADKFGDNREGEAIWSYNRFGQSLTPLPDGRFIEMGGGQESYQDPDFCIYNDVMVHDGKGNCDIYIYPLETFIPTEFHTATLVNGHIYIIGNFGYYGDVGPGYTPIFRLDISTMRMQKMESDGEMPGWINRHKAYYDGKSTITIKGGRVCVSEEQEQDYHDNKHTYLLCLRSMRWRKLD